MVYKLPSDGLDTSSVTTPKINDNAVTTAKINAGAVTLAKCETGLTNALVPVGGIIIWSGNLTDAENLTAWAVCDGRTKNNLTTPNLTDRFVVGAQTSSGSYAVNGTGGSANAVVVEHTHGITEPNNGDGHRHSFTDDYNGLGGGVGGGGANTGTTSNTDNTAFATTGITINNAGESGVGKNLPPYYALLYIMRVA